MRGKGKVMNFKQSEIPKLKKLCEEAKEEGRIKFEYRGVILLTDYARYLIENLEDIYNK